MAGVRLAFDQSPMTKFQWRRGDHPWWAPTLNDYRLWQFLLGTLRPIVTTHGRISSWVRRVSRGPSQPSTIPKLSRTKVHPVDPLLYSLGETTPVAMPSLASPSLRNYPYLTRGSRLHTSKEVVGTKPTYCSPGTSRLTFDVRDPARCAQLRPLSCLARTMIEPGQSQDEPQAHGVQCPQRSSEPLV